jgi:septum formation protein
MPEAAPVRSAAGASPIQGSGVAPVLILASGSAARAALLRAAGVPIEIDPAALDEDEIKADLRRHGVEVGQVAEQLARRKAIAVSARHPGRLVLGADQMLVCAGRWFDKPADLAAARAQLEMLAGKTHELVTGVSVVRDRVPLWRMSARARLTMRALGPEALDAYLAAAGADVLGSVGAYRLEGLGAQLFEHIDGDFFTILGLPLLPVLAFLRREGILAA